MSATKYVINPEGPEQHAANALFLFHPCSLKPRLLHDDWLKSPDVIQFCNVIGYYFTLCFRKRDLHVENGWVRKTRCYVSRFLAQCSFSLLLYSEWQMLRLKRSPLMWWISKTGQLFMCISSSILYMYIYLRSNITSLWKCYNIICAIGQSTSCYV